MSLSIRGAEAFAESVRMTTLSLGVLGDRQTHSERGNKERKGAANDTRWGAHVGGKGWMQNAVEKEIWIRLCISLPQDLKEGDERKNTTGMRMPTHQTTVQSVVTLL